MRRHTVCIMPDLHLSCTSCSRQRHRLGLPCSCSGQGSLAEQPLQRAEPPAPAPTLCEPESAGIMRILQPSLLRPSLSVLAAYPAGEMRASLLQRPVPANWPGAQRAAAPVAAAATAHHVPGGWSWGRQVSGSCDSPAPPLSPVSAMHCGPHTCRIAPPCRPVRHARLPAPPPPRRRLRPTSSTRRLRRRCRSWTSCASQSRTMTMRAGWHSRT